MSGPTLTQVLLNLRLYYHGSTWFNENTKTLVPNRVWKSVSLVPSPSIKKRGQSASWLSEEGKDRIMTSLSLLEQPNCTCIHMQKILIKVTNLIKQFI